MAIVDKHPPFVHANCGGEIEETALVNELARAFRCLKCGERWKEQIVII